MCSSATRSNNVLVLDPGQDYAVVKEIPISRRPRDMNFDQRHEFLYVACGDDDLIDVIDVGASKWWTKSRPAIAPRFTSLPRTARCSTFRTRRALASADGSIVYG